MKINVAEAIVKCLEIEGIKYAFGITGSHYLALFNALKNSSIKYVSVKHEGAAGFIALNYTKITQKPALILGTSGPGAANLINGIAEMYKSGIPGIVLTPLVSTNLFGKNSYQEDTGYGTTYSINRIMENITRKSILLISPEKITDLMHEAFRYALTSPYGPVHISIPSNFLCEEIDFEDLKPNQYRLSNDTRIEIDRLNILYKFLQEANFPVLLIGNRCIYPDCSVILQKLIDNLHIPFILTHGSKGVLDEHQDLFGGILDYFGHRSAEKIIKDSDLVLAIGMDFSEAETIRYDPDLFKNSKLIILDSDTRQIGINYPSKLSISGNIFTSIQMFIQLLKDRNFYAKWNNLDIKAKFVEYNKHQINEMTTITSPLKPQYIFGEISKLLDKNTILFTDTGASSFSSIRHIVCYSKGYYSSSTGYSMGQAVAGCIGGKLACPEKNVICICGDGGFLMHGNEVLTASQYELGITWIVFCDSLFNMVNINQRLAYNDLEFCVKFKNPDFSLLAKAYNCDYFEVNNSGDLEKSINNARKANSNNISALIIIKYDYDQHLPLKDRMVKTMQDMGQTKDIKSNPHLMRAFKKILKEKV